MVVDFFPKTTSKAVNCYVYIYSVSEIKRKKEFLQEISLGLQKHYSFRVNDTTY